VEPHHLGHLLPHGEHGVQARHRLLEDHPDAAAAHPPQLRLRQTGEIERVAARVEQDLAGLDRARRGYEAEDRHRRHALAAAALAHEPEHAAALDLERHAVHRRHAAGGRVKRRHEVPDFEERHGYFRASRSRGSVASWSPSPMRL
jgi:hypothetical protein